MCKVVTFAIYILNFKYTVNVIIFAEETFGVLPLLQLMYLIMFFIGLLNIQ